MELKEIYTEEGFTTIGVASAMLICLSLIFSAAKVYEIQTASAQIQEVADAAVLAAENTIAEFYMIANVCDSILFSCALGSVILHGIGVLVSCIPPVQSSAHFFFSSGQKLSTFRDNFYDHTTRVLSQLQTVLPVLAQAKLLMVLRANSHNTYDENYYGIGFLVPDIGEPIQFNPYEKSKEFEEDSATSSESLASESAEIENLAQQAHELKELAYRHDSGSKTNYCMYERAQHLSAIPPYQNPYFASIDTWTFSAALKRAQYYYQWRLHSETPANNSVEEQGRSQLRSIFYQYAVEELNHGYVH